MIRSHYRHGFINQYVRDHFILRTEATTNNVTDYDVNKAVEHLPALRGKLSAINGNYLVVQQDILETFVDRGQLHRLAAPTITPSGTRILGLKLDHPRQLALMHALVRFAHIAAGRTFSTAEIHPHVLAALGATARTYSRASLRYGLSKLRAKGLVVKLANSRRYQLLPQGSSCDCFCRRRRLSDRTEEASGEGSIVSTARHRRSRCPRPHRWPQSRLIATPNENKILVRRFITV